MTLPGQFSRNRVSKLFVLLVCIFSLIPPPAAFGQFLGQVEIQTVQAQLANNLACTGNPQNFITNQGIVNFSNLGQTIHQASATSAAASFIMEIDGIDVAGNIVRISNPTAQFQPTSLINGYVAQGSGYYPNIQVSVTCTAAATFSMTYSGSTGGSGTQIVGTPGAAPILVPSLAADVQGIVPRGSYGGIAYPLITGALAPAINLGVAKLGIDTFSAVSGPFVSGGITGNVTLASPPQPSANGEYVIAFFGPIVMVGTGSFPGPWTCFDAGCSVSSNSAIEGAFLNNYTTANPLVMTYNNSTASVPEVVFVSFTKAPTQRQHVAGSTNSFALPSNSIAGSTILFAMSCTGNGACTPNGLPTDTQGNPYKLVAVAPANPSFGTSNTIYVYAGGPTSAAADTVTLAMTAGTIAASDALELSAITPANLNTPSIPLFASNPINKISPNEDDNGGIFTQAGGFDYTQTVTLTPAGTTTFPLWNQPLTGLFYSCTVALRVTAASGTTPTLDTFFQDSGDNVGFNDRLHFTQAVTTGNFLGAVSGGVGGINPVVTTDGVLAAGTKLDGPLSAFGRIKFVVGGTTPSFTVTYNVACR